MKLSKIPVSLAVIAITIAGCATVTPQRQEKMSESMPVCYSDSDCKTKWAAARDWIQSNAGYKIQIYSDDLIETFNSAQADPKISVSATKKPVRKGVDGNTTNIISVSVRCGNMFGCVPDSSDAVMSFNRYVSNAEIADSSCYADMLKTSDAPRAGYFTEGFKSKLVVKRVCSETPAKRAGLTPNDVITAMNGVQLTSLESYKSATSNFQFGGKLEIEVLRDEMPMTLVLQLPSKEEHDKLRALATTPANTGIVDVEKKIESLMRMQEKGLITREEFEAKKKQLLVDM